MQPRNEPISTFFGKFLYDQVISPNDPLILLKNTINWDLIRRIIETDEEGLTIEYSDEGRPALDPIIIFKLLILQRWNPNSDRKVIERANSDIRYRCFLDLPIPLSLPNYSNLSKFRKRWGEKKFKNLFQAIFQQIQQFGFADVSEGVVADVTHSKAPVQVPTARELISNLFMRYLEKLTIINSKNPDFLTSNEISSIISNYNLWYEEYSAKIRLEELSREKRFDLLLNKLFEVWIRIENIFPSSIPTFIQSSKEWIQFEEIKTNLSIALGENANYIAKVSDQKKKNKQKGNSKVKSRKNQNSEQESGFDSLSAKELLHLIQNSDEDTNSTNTNGIKGIFKQKKGKKTIISSVDPEVRKGCKHKTKFFNGTKIGTTMTQDDFIVSMDTVQGNIADKSLTEDMIKQAIENSGQIPEKIALDKGFDSVDVRKTIHSYGIQALIDFKKTSNPKNKDKLTKEAFHFELNTMTVTCKAGIETKKFTKNNSTENFVFTFPMIACNNCEFKNQCTTSSSGRSISFSFHHQLLEEDKEILATPESKKFRKKLWNLESRFGNAKNSHNLGYTPYIGTADSGIHHQLVGIVLNGKKLIKKLYFPNLPKFKSSSPSGASI